MQTLSLNTPQTAQSGLTELVDKGSLNGNALASGSEKTPFQQELSKQINARKQSSEGGQPKSVSLKNQTLNHPVSKHHASAKAEKPTAVNGAEAAENLSADVGALSSPDAVSMLLALRSTGDAEDADVSAALSDKEKLMTEMLSSQSSGVDVAALVGVNANLVISGKGEKIAGVEQNADLSDGYARAEVAVAGERQRPVAVAADNQQPQLMDKASEVRNAVVDNVAAKLQGRMENVPDKSALKETGLELAASRVAANMNSDATSRDFSSVMTTTSQSPVMHSSFTQAASASNLAAAQQAGSSTFINAYPGKAGWDQAISQRVVWMVGAGEQSATLTLNPPELGPLKVVIQVHNDQADATFISDSDEVRRALESGIANLREKMSESGVQLGQASVSTSSQSQQNFQQTGQGRTAGQSNAQANAAQTDTSASVRVSTRASDGLVDTFV